VPFHNHFENHSHHNVFSRKIAVLSHTIYVSSLPFPIKFKLELQRIPHFLVISTRDRKWKTFANHSTRSDLSPPNPTSLSTQCLTKRGWRQSPPKVCTLKLALKLTNFVSKLRETKSALHSSPSATHNALENFSKWTMAKCWEKDILHIDGYGLADLSGEIF